MGDNGEDEKESSDLSIVPAPGFTPVRNSSVNISPQLYSFAPPAGLHSTASPLPQHQQRFSEAGAYGPRAQISGAGVGYEDPRLQQYSQQNHPRLGSSNYGFENAVLSTEPSEGPAGDRDESNQQSENGIAAPLLRSRNDGTTEFDQNLQIQRYGRYSVTPKSASIFAMLLAFVMIYVDVIYPFVEGSSWPSWLKSRGKKGNGKTHGGNGSGGFVSRSIRVLQCASALSKGKGFEQEGSPANQIVSSQIAAATWMMSGAARAVEVPSLESCSWDTEFGSVYALGVLKEEWKMTNWTSRKPLSGIQDICRSNWPHITCNGAKEKIVSLTFNNAGLSGKIPVELIGLGSGLTSLDLDKNEGIVGTIPEELGMLRALERLYLQGTSLTGSVPSGLGQLSLMTQLLLDHTHLSGRMPSEICQLRQDKLQALSVNCASGKNTFYVECEHPKCCSACTN